MYERRWVEEDEIPYRECFTSDGKPKIQYWSRKDAKYALRQNRGYKGKVYRCTHCNAFHLGVKHTEGEI